ncbi:hypothetical protein [Streptomyces sp. NPDC001970]
MPLIEHDGRDYALQIMYAVPDDAWYLELHEAAREIHLVTAIVPDEDPDREPTVRFDERGGHRDVPYEVMRWFMDRVAAEIENSRAWMALDPPLVEVVRQLRQVFQGAVSEEDFPPLLVVLSDLLSQRNLGLVVEGAFGIDRDEAVHAAASALSSAPSPGKPSRRAVRALRERMAADGWTVTDDGRSPSGTTYE